MGVDVRSSSLRFQPLRPASRASLIAGSYSVPLLWLLAVAIAALVFEYSWAIALNLAVTVASFFFSFVVVGLLRAGRVRQAERYVDRG